VGGENYDMPKTVLMLVVESSNVAVVVKTIEDNARTESIGDGRIFVAPVAEAHTIRTGEPGL
jgi:nitrogen regulatory protein PII 1